MILRYSLTKTLRHGPFFSRWSGRSGVALVIVLMFVVLLTGLVLVLLSRALSNGLISGASSNGTRTDLYAHGAVEQIIGDLRQEIADGSTVSITSTLYRPKQSGNAVPYLAGPISYTSSSLWNTTFANVVKESTYKAPFYQTSGASNQTYSNQGLSRAAPISTTGESVYVTPGSSPGTSLNGRYVSAARWNQALLLPKKTATSLDTTPVSTFVAPDWVLSTVDPTVPVPTTYSADMSNPQKPSYVVGRYAYTIYNEGGLLDANVAGTPNGAGFTAGGTYTYPPASLAKVPSTPGWPSQQVAWGKKGPASFADLSILPGISQVTSVSPQKVVNALVGWRNTATAQSSTSGALSAYTFPSAGIDNYFASILGRFTQFMTVGSYKGISDNAFTSRQQLISFLQNVAGGSTADQAYLQNAMMYLGTFSRTLNQPSYWPDPTRPKENSGGAGWSTNIWPGVPGSYTGYNDAVDQEGNYNPPFRLVRVTNPFSRNDGTSAVFGEPLVKKRFALNRLAWITPYGPISNGPGSLNPAVPASMITYLKSPEIGLTQSFLEEGTGPNIKKYFGLIWNGGGLGGFWTYDPTLIYNGTNIGLLTDAQSGKREPNFFELLQAAVKVGAISNPSLYNNNGGGEHTGPYAQRQDTEVIFQILQMGADIIDEANVTQYPTHIRFTYAGTVQDIYGVTDLPYFYAYKNICFVSKVAVPPAPGTGTVNNDTLTYEGQIAGLIVPVIWNPYDVNGPATPLAGIGFAPKNLRITAAYGSPQASSVQGWNISLASSVDGHSPTPTIIFPPPPAVLPPIRFTNYPWPPDTGGADTAALTFSNAPNLYREPTALLQPGAKAPAGSNLASTATAAGTYTEAATGTPLVGFPLGTAAQRWTEKGAPGKPNNTYTANGLNLGGPAQSFTIRVEYQNPNGGAWVPYQTYWLNGDQQMKVPCVTSPTVLTPQGSSYWDAGSAVTWGTRFLYDPRTGRWGTYLSLDNNFPLLAFLDNTDTITESVRPSNNRGNGAGGVGPKSGWFPGGTLRPGDIEQNVIPNNPNNLNYYNDADGVVRRAMAGYVPVSANVQTTNVADCVGLPLAIAPSLPSFPPGTPVPTPYKSDTVSAAYTPMTYQSQSRPIILHRPFRSVAELGYVFSGTPFRNIDFFTPESGYSAVLDTFCIDDDTRPDAVAAGRVDLNTRQAPVLQALLAGAYRDEELGLAAAPGTALSDLTNTEAMNVAKGLVTRTTVGGTNPKVITTGPQPLSNIGDLVGKYVKSVGAPINGPLSYDGFSADLANTVSPLYIPGATNSNIRIQRFLESTMRALSDAGQAGTWNLMIDLVAQTGRYPSTAANAANSLAAFLVEGERHYWVHLAIDRQTGQVIDENIEAVNE